MRTDKKVRDTTGGLPVRFINFIANVPVMKKQFKSKYPVDLSITDDQGRPLNFCGIRCAMEVLGGKWKLLIVAELAKGASRYSELKRSIPEISEKMLTRSLRELELHELVHKTSEGVSKYQLTEYGQSVLPLLKALFDWGEKHIELHHDLIFH
jgi:DNA-binding HxlR family transcriptional regulator